MKRFQVELMLIFVVLFWGGNYTFSKWAMNQLSPELLTLFRFSIVFPVLLLGTCLLERSVHIDKKDWKRLLLLGFLGIALYQTLFMSSVKYTSSMNASLLNALSPIFTGIISVLSGQERFTWRVQIGSLISFGGTALIILFGNSSAGFSAYPHHLYGDLIGVAAAFIFGIYPILTTPLLLKYSSLRITAWSSGIAIPFLLLFNISSLQTIASMHLTEVTWIGVLYAAIPVTVYGLTAWSYGVSKIGSTSVMVYMYAVPLISAVISYFTLHEQIHFFQVVGGVILFAGITIVKTKSRSNRKIETANVQAL